MGNVFLFGTFPVGNSRNGWPVSLHNADADLHALVHLSPQSACSSLEHLQVQMFILLPKRILSPAWFGNMKVAIYLYSLYKQRYCLIISE